MRTRRLPLAVTLMLLLAGATVGAAADRSDRDLLRAISGRMGDYTQLSMFDSVAAEVLDGRVVLRGWVTVPFKREDLERRVSRVDGVRAVENAIEVLPASQFDDTLRYRVARAIYGHDAFLHYAALANPPIRIVVDRGRVTLTGIVHSDVERLLARTLATGFGAFEVTNALRTDAEVRYASGATY